VQNGDAIAHIEINRTQLSLKLLICIKLFAETPIQSHAVATGAQTGVDVGIAPEQHSPKPLVSRRRCQRSTGYLEDLLTVLYDLHKR
jgi:hypothetical protein